MQIDNKSSRQKEKVSLLPALGIILGSLLLTAALFIVSFQYYTHVLEMRKSDNKYNIAAVIQTGHEKEPLETSYLIELMDLSIDKPINLYSINEKSLEQRLIRSPLVKTAAVNKEFPHTLYVDYEARKPVAYLKDYSNALLSEDGLLLPFKPFFSPKNFPQVYLGQLIEKKDNLFGLKIPEATNKLIQESMAYSQSFFEERGLKVRFIDFSNARLPNKERSEIVLFVEGKSLLPDGKVLSGEYLLRLGSHSYKEGLALFDLIMKKEQVRLKKLLIDRINPWHFTIDLRTRGMALVKP